VHEESLKATILIVRINHAREEFSRLRKSDRQEGKRRKPDDNISRILRLENCSACDEVHVLCDFLQISLGGFIIFRLGSRS
jgi:hypothetical protein